jgi:hypothetical protein
MVNICVTVYWVEFLGDYFGFSVFLDGGPPTTENALPSPLFVF